MTDEYKGLNENKVISLLNKFYSAFLGIYKNENFKYYIENFLILNIPCIVRLILNKNKKGE